MATETKKKKKTSIRTEPKKKAHQEIIELVLNPGTQKMLLQHIEQLEKSMIRASKDLEDFVLENVVEGVIEAGNAKLDPSMRQTSLPLYSADGKTLFSINQQINQGFDGRSLQATALIWDFIKEAKKTKSVKFAFTVTMLETMLFGASRTKKFRMTPELKKFMAMKDEELPDERLIQARDILNESHYVKRSKWYFGIKKWDEKQSDYITLEEHLFGTAGE